MAGPLGMILVGDGRAKEGHDPVPPELPDRPLNPVDLLHQDPAAAVHSSVDIFRVQLFGHGSEAGYVGEHHRHQLALAFDSAAVGQDLIGQVLGV